MFFRTHFQIIMQQKQISDVFDLADYLILRYSSPVYYLGYRRDALGTLIHVEKQPRPNDSKDWLVPFRKLSQNNNIFWQLVYREDNQSVVVAAGIFLSQNLNLFLYISRVNLKIFQEAPTLFINYQHENVTVSSPQQLYPEGHLVVELIDTQGASYIYDPMARNYGDKSTLIPLQIYAKTRFQVYNFGHPTMYRTSCSAMFKKVNYFNNVFIEHFKSRLLKS